MPSGQNRESDTRATEPAFEQLLHALGYTNGEHLSINHQPTGGDFTSEVIPYSAAAIQNIDLTVGRNVWFGVNPTMPRPIDGDGKRRGRGGADDVTRLAAIWCDLDVKDGACRDLDHAHRIIDELSAILGVRPTVVVQSGGGLHPYWPIDDGQIAGGDADIEAQLRVDAAALLKRWGRLACIVADGLGARIDRGVYDLPRVLRVPGSLNHKYEPPVMVTMAVDTGGPITLDELRDRLDEHGVADHPPAPGENTAQLPQGGQFAPIPWCEYTAPMLDGWRTEQIHERHPWLLSRLVRLECARAVGCLTKAQYTAGVELIVERFRAALTAGQPPRQEAVGEVSTAMAEARRLAAGKGVRQLLAELGGRPHLHLLAGNRLTPAPAAVAPRRHVTPDRRAELLAAARGTFRRWLGEDYDLDALDAVLVTVAVEQLDGDPLWLLVVTGSGNAKTETVCAAADVDGVHVVSSIASEGALLSATSKRERSTAATGGLLRQIGSRGTIVVKDVTTVLSMDRTARAQVLAALREVYDGQWVRQVGTDGGQALPWEGRVAFIGAVTTAWDTHHSVVSTMGDRFVLLRTSSRTGRQRAGRQAIRNTGSEKQMRAEMSAAVAAVIAAADRQAVELTDDETDRLLAAADVVTLTRTAVEFDYRGDPVQAHAPEMPTRFAKQLAQVLRGAVAVGMSRDDGLRLALRCARDSMPPIRLAVLDHLTEHGYRRAGEIVTALKMPRTTVNRQLEAMHLLGVLDCDETQRGGYGGFVRGYSLAEGVDGEALQVPPAPENCPVLLVEVHTSQVGGAI